MHTIEYRNADPHRAADARGPSGAHLALRALPQSRLVVPNRGIWICH